MTDAVTSTVIVGPSTRRLVEALGTALGAAGLAVPLVTASPARGWQAAVGLVGVIAYVLAPRVEVAMALAVASAATSAGLALIDTEAPVVVLGLCGVLALAACELLGLAGAWRTAVPLDREIEQRFVEAIARRVGLGVLAAALVLAVGMIELPSAAVAVAAGAIATAALLVLTTQRD